MQKQSYPLLVTFADRFHLKLENRLMASSASGLCRSARCYLCRLEQALHDLLPLLLHRVLRNRLRHTPAQFRGRPRAANDDASCASCASGGSLHVAVRSPSQRPGRRSAAPSTARSGAAFRSPCLPPPPAAASSATAPPPPAQPAKRSGKYSGARRKNRGRTRRCSMALRGVGSTEASKCSLTILAFTRSMRFSMSTKCIIS